MTDRAERPPKDNPDGPLVERQVGERLSEQVLRGRYDFPLEGASFVGASIAKKLARQLAEAERENERMREALGRIAGLAEADKWDTLADFARRAALNPPDPPASPAEYHAHDFTVEHPSSDAGEGYGNFTVWECSICGKTPDQVRNERAAAPATEKDGGA